MTNQTNNFMNLFHGLKMSNAIIIIFLTRNSKNLQIQWSLEIKKEDGEKETNDAGLDDLMVPFTDIVEFFYSFFFIYHFFVFYLFIFRIYTFATYI